MLILNIIMKKYTQNEKKPKYYVIFLDALNTFRFVSFSI